MTTATRGRRAREAITLTIGRPGFTLFELLVAITLTGLLVAFSYPRVSRMASQGSLRTARGALILAVNAAKSAAVTSGRCGFLRLSGSEVTVFTDVCQGSGAQAEVISHRSFQDEYGVIVAMQKGGGAPRQVDSFGFDPRGIPTDHTQSVLFAIAKGGDTTTVRVQNYGKIQ